MSDVADDERKLTRTVRRTATDPQTGQVLELVWEETLKRRPPAKGRSAEPFCLVFPENLDRLTAVGLQGADRSVFWGLVAVMGFEEPFRYSTAMLAAGLGMHKQHVSRSLTRLRHAGLIITIGPPRDRRILLDPLVVWRGSSQTRVGWLARLDPAKKERPDA